MYKVYTDSTGTNKIHVGTEVRFRGKIYTIKSFAPDPARPNSYSNIFFEEEQHIEEQATELSVDVPSGVDLALHEEEQKNITQTFWLSFVDSQLPKGQRFLGVVVVTALGPAHAMRLTHELGVNPGGEIQIAAISKDMVPLHHQNILLDKATCEVYGEQQQ